MSMWDAINELNEAKAALALALNATEYPWVWIGDANVEHGGTALQVSSDRHYVTIVEVSDLRSAIGQEGCVLIQRGSVALDMWGKAAGRRRLRGALQTSGITLADLAKLDRTRRAVEMALACWTYGMRDEDGQDVIRYEPAPEDTHIPGGGYMEPDEEVDGTAALTTRVMEALD